MVALDHVMGSSWYRDNKDELRDEYEADEIRRLMSWSDFLVSRYTEHVQHHATRPAANGIAYHHSRG